MIPIERYRELGPERCIEIIQERIGDAPLYITFDLDCLDPSVAPAVSNLEPGVSGFTIDEAIRLLRAVRGMDVIGADVVCLMPTKDSAEPDHRDGRGVRDVRADQPDRRPDRPRLSGS